MRSFIDPATDEGFDGEDRGVDDYAKPDEFCTGVESTLIEEVC